MLLFYRLPAKGKLAILSILFLLALLWRPVDVLVVAPSSEAPLFRKIAPLGQEFWMRYIHSVERTPVLDCYRIVNGRLWFWRAYFRSHNAGLPFAGPSCGRFIMEPPWMIVEGGRQHWRSLALRVGNAEFGRNALAWSRGMPSAWTLIYESHSDRRLLVETTRQPLLDAAVLDRAGLPRPAP